MTTPKRRGRPPKAEGALTPAERKRRERSRLRNALAGVEEEDLVPAPFLLTKERATTLRRFSKETNTHPAVVLNLITNEAIARFMVYARASAEERERLIKDPRFAKLADLLSTLDRGQGNKSPPDGSS